MKRLKGKVIGVFIPKEYKNGALIDVMYRKNIGFKIETEEGIKEIIEKQDEYNSKIMKGDTVLITKQKISDKTFTDIELLEDYND